MSLLIVGTYLPKYMISNSKKLHYPLWRLAYPVGIR